jgi:hypothetical protein
MCPDDDGRRLTSNSTAVAVISEGEMTPTEGERMFCTLFSSMMTLFTVGVLGDYLYPALIAIKDKSLLLMWLFVVFFVISFITLLNMLIGVLVQVIAESSDQEAEKNQVSSLRRALISAFEEADKSHDKRISQEEWAQMCDSPHVKQTLVKLGVDQGSIRERLMQMEETIFGARSGNAGGNSPQRYSSVRVEPNTNTIGYNEFEEKVKDLRWDTPAKAVDLELLRSASHERTVAMRQQLKKVEGSLKMWAAKRQSSRRLTGAAPSGGTTEGSWYPKTGQKAPFSASWGPDGGLAADAATTWLQEVPTEMLFHILKTRAPHSC